MDEVDVSYAVIGGHAVNTWLEPRFTADLEGLCALDAIDWDYVEEWARAWDVSERVARFRNT